ncbi:MAG: CapA family protein [Chloroflexota bacterium]|nr:CapA family protein [Chloroflexota bacterium]
MPVTKRVIARPPGGKQSPHLLFTFLIIALTVSAACSTPAPTLAPPVIQDAPPAASSLQVNTATPTPAAVVIHESVPWVYALVAPFPTVTDGLTFEELQRQWTEAIAPSAFEGRPLLMDESVLATLSALWGDPAAGAVEVVAAGQLLETAWSEMPSWAIVSFEQLEPRWKVLTVDGQSPIRKDFDLATYPLVANITLQSSSDIQSSVFSLPPSNYDPSRMTTVVMTGVTALVRATAFTMELKGVTYPGERVRDLLREADIAHISNEIPFFTGCTFPKPNQAMLVFCSDPKYIDLLTDIGADVIELTGNHFADRGAAGMRETIEIYQKHGLPYFGGGLDLEDALKPALFEVNGNKIAFIGCNKPDVGRFPTATEFQPGAAPCDFEYLAGMIGSLRAQGYMVISTFQWNESYDSRPSPQQMRDFRLMADSGASIVSGSQAHYAQMMEFHDGAFIHYGLGNLFFDQMGDQDWMPRGIRREFIDRYVIYNGKLISVELITAMLEDYARPRLMTEQERLGFLQEYFYYSGWIPLNATPTPTITPTLTPMSIPPFAGTPTP